MDTDLSPYAESIIYMNVYYTQTNTVLQEWHEMSWNMKSNFIYVQNKYDMYLLLFYKFFNYIVFIKNICHAAKY